MQKRTAMFNMFVGIFQRGGCTISKSRNTRHTQTRRSATTRYRPWRSRCARVKRQLLRKWPRGLPHLRELLLFCACVRAGANLRPNSTTSGEEMPCPDLRLRSGRNTPFRWIFRSWNCQKQHSSPHAVYTYLTVRESCLN